MGCHKVWEFVHERQKVNTHAFTLKYKTCGHKFVGGATCIKQHCMSLGIDVDASTKSTTFGFAVSCHIYVKKY